MADEFVAVEVEDDDDDDDDDCCCDGMTEVEPDFDNCGICCFFLKKKPKFNEIFNKI